MDTFRGVLPSTRVPVTAAAVEVEVAAAEVMKGRITTVVIEGEFTLIHLKINLGFWGFGVLGFWGLLFLGLLLWGFCF